MRDFSKSLYFMSQCLVDSECIMNECALCVIPKIEVAAVRDRICVYSVLVSCGSRIHGVKANCMRFNRI